MSEDFVPAGSPSGWYRHPYRPIDYFWTGRGFGTVGGEHIRRRHSGGELRFEPAERGDAADWVRQYGVDSAGESIPPDRIVTIDHLPGYQVVKVMGLVTELTSASGWTAKSKGNTALEGALRGLVASAVDLGGNAIVGFAASTFGAHGGLTAGFGGDAVGVLLTGTAVTVSRTPNP